MLGSRSLREGGFWLSRTMTLACGRIILHCIGYMAWRWVDWPVGIDLLGPGLESLYIFSELAYIACCITYPYTFLIAFNSLGFGNG